ncbi:hypothetical protein R69746_05202 [Paraburkholderia aspalathi]|nr:hypothetical protein R69746_05202 [Paraburkholderia aspalathi]
MSNLTEMGQIRAAREATQRSGQLLPQGLRGSRVRPDPRAAPGLLARGV